jgi:CHASE2 domain-containing sensor protein
MKMNKITQYLDFRKWPTDKQREFLFNIVLGIGFMVAFILLQNTSARQAVINSWFDKYIDWRYEIDSNKFILQNVLPGLKKSDAKRASEEIVFLRFDGQAFKTLGRPVITPRDKVADLVNIAYKGGAKIIYLDMLFSERDYTPATMKPLAGDVTAKDGLSRDRILEDLLNEIKNDSGSQTRVLLPLETYEIDGKLKDIIFSSKGGSIIDNHKIFAVTPKFTRANDSRIRFWLPYEGIKDQDNKGKIADVLWSVPITALSLLHGSEQQLVKLREDILKRDRFDNDDEEFMLELPDRGGAFTFYRENYKNNASVRDSEHHQYNRIQYTLMQDPIDKRTIRSDHIGSWQKGGSHLDNDDIEFKDKIVIIGRDDPDCKDFHDTPVGKMAGMYVHANSIATILGETQPYITTTGRQILVDMLLILLTAYGYALLPSYLVKYFLTLLTLVFVPFSFLYFCQTNEFVYISWAFASIGALRLWLSVFFTKIQQRAGR